MASSGPIGGRARRIAEDLRGQIARGIYPPGSVLPSTRALAEELGVSRGTVTSAYEQLHAEGFLETMQGARTRVAQGVRPVPLPDLSSQPPPATAISAWAARVADLPPPPARAEGMAVDFRYGDLSGWDFPTLGWKRALDAAALRRPDRLHYEAASGVPSLRHALQAYLWRSRGLRCEADQIIVVGGSQQGIDLAARVLVDPGDTIVVENPCYQMARQVFAATGARLASVPADEDGLQTAALSGVETARLAFVTPSHQFPLGGVLPAVRRREVLAWAERAAAWILEDDYDGEFRYHPRPVPPLHVLGGDRVLYLGTASKSLSPRLRLGWLVVPRPLVDLFARAKSLHDRHTAALEQEALAAFIESGAYERHIRRVRRRYAERRAAIIAGLEQMFGDRVHIAGAAAGLHVIAWFKDVPHRCEAQVIEAARTKSVGVYGIGPLYAVGGQTPPAAGLVLGYAALSPQEIRRGLRLLAGAMQ